MLEVIHDRRAELLGPDQLVQSVEEAPVTARDRWIGRGPLEVIERGHILGGRRADWRREVRRDNAIKSTHSANRANPFTHLMRDAIRRNQKHT